MSGEYLLRLAGLSLAVYFAVHLAVGLAARALVRPAARLNLRPRDHARLLLVLRWLPTLLAAAVVAAVCVPSYLKFEPGDTGEELSLVCVSAAILTAVLWAGAALRGMRQLLRSRRRVKECSASTPLIAIAGFVKPRLLISPAVAQALDEEQLAAAIRHEQAHAAACDNCKRLLLAFTPGLLPGIRGFAALERQWSRYTELAADDDAVAGDPHRAVALASALVRVARLGSASLPLASSLLEGDGLTERVDRLLNPRPYLPNRALITAATVVGSAAACLCAWALRPESLESAHHLLEHLVR